MFTVQNTAMAGLKPQALVEASALNLTGLFLRDNKNKKLND